MFYQRVKCPPLLVFIGHRSRLSENNHASIIHRVIERRARKDNSIEQRDRHADLIGASRHGHQPAGCSSVQVQHIADARIHCWNDEWRAVINEADVRDEPLVQNRENFVALGYMAFRMSP